MRKYSTKEIIISTFSDLLRKKPFHAFSVTDVIEESNISRSTFYRHFTDKQAVLEYIFQKEIAEKNFYDFSRSIEAREAEIADALRQDVPFWMHAFEVSAFYDLWSREAAKATLGYLKPLHPDAPELEFFCGILGNGFASINHAILLGKVRESPSEIGQRFQRVIDTYLRVE